MPICAHCSTPTDALFVSYGPSHLVCTRCKACGAFADPYVEHEAIIVAIDLILVKPRAYRHLLFNRAQLYAPLDDVAARKKDKQPRQQERHRVRLWLAVMRYFVAMLLVDAYLRWFYLCGGAAAQSNTSLLPRIDRDNVLRSYAWIAAATCATMVALHATVLLLSTAYHRALCHLASRGKRGWLQEDELARFRMHLVPTALLLSNLTPTLLLCLLALWQPPPPSEEAGTLPSPTDRHASVWQWNEASIDWTIRSLVSGLSAGVGLGVVLPLQRTKVGALTATTILMSGWYVQFEVSRLFHLPFHSGVGVLQTDLGRLAASHFCSA